MFTLDLNLLQAAQSVATPWLTTLMRLISNLFIPEVLVPLIMVIVVILLIKHKRLQEVLLLLILAGNTFTLVLKPIIHRPRPTAAQVTLYVQETDSSMPSGHALLAMTIGGAVILLDSKKKRPTPLWLTTLVSIGILLVGFSRIYLGAHWPSDVLAGYLIGWLWLVFIWHWVKPRLEKRYQKVLK